MSVKTEQPARRKMYIDPDTGEYVSGLSIYEAVALEVVPQKRFDWLKIYPRLIPKLQRILNSKSFDVVVYCLQLTRYGTNEFRASRTEISKATGVAPATVNRVFDGLLSADLIRSVGGSTWMVNPAIIHGGSQAMDVSLGIRYMNLQMHEKARKVIAPKTEEQTEMEMLVDELLRGEINDDDY